MLLECIAMSAFSSNFNLSKKFTTFDFRVWILSLQIYNFISVSQIHIGETVDKLNKHWLTLLRVNYKHWPWFLLQFEDFLYYSLQCEVGWTHFLLLSKNN